MITGSACLVTLWTPANIFLVADTFGSDLTGWANFNSGYTDPKYFTHLQPIAKSAAPSAAGTARP